MFDVSLFNEYRYLIKLLYYYKSNRDYGTTYKIEFNIDYIIERITYIEIYRNDVVKEFRNLKKRNETLNKRISKICKYDEPVFLTLTFTDKTLKKTSRLTRKRYVKEFLRNNCYSYVANIDFGKATGREHYHAVVSNKVDFTNWKYGSINGIPVVNESKALSMYIAKLSHHALKDSTDIKQRLIYSKG